MEAILTVKLNIVSLERYSERDTTQWKIKAECDNKEVYIIHAEYHDHMLHVHLESTTNPKVVSRIELKGGSTVLFNMYLFENESSNEMSNEQFKTYMSHLFHF